MTATGITYDDVAAAAEALSAQGEHPSIMRVREYLQTGSPNTIHKRLKQWRESQAPAARPAPEIPAPLARSMVETMDAYAAERAAEAQQEASRARAEADQLAETGEQVENERDAALERAENAESEAAAATQRAESAESDLERMTSERDDLRVRIEQNVQELSDARARVESLTAERDRLSNQVESLRNEAAAAGPLRDEVQWFRSQFNVSSNQQ